jgi:hypothetical protein
MARWTHAADYPPGSFGRMMHDLEQKATDLAAQGIPGPLAQVDQLSAKYDGHLASALHAALNAAPPA